MVSELEKIFSNVNEWLKVAEAKNAVLLSLNGAFFLSTISEFKTISLKSASILFILFFSALCIIILLLLASFIPLLTKKFLPDSKKKKNIQTPNLVYFGHLKNMTEEDLLNSLSDKENDDLDKITRLEKDYANQIIINSKIAFLKYRIFSISCILDMIAILLFAAYVIT
ncbi:MAG: Pycsar system effector family protein [bacterium]